MDQIWLTFSICHTPLFHCHLHPPISSHHSPIISGIQLNLYLRIFQIPLFLTFHFHYTFKKPISFFTFLTFRKLALSAWPLTSAPPTSLLLSQLFPPIHSPISDPISVSSLGFHRNHPFFYSPRLAVYIILTSRWRSSCLLLWLYLWYSVDTGFDTPSIQISYILIELKIKLDCNCHSRKFIGRLQFDLGNKRKMGFVDFWSIYLPHLHLNETLKYYWGISQGLKK